MNCCWILLLLLMGGRGCCNTAGSRTSDNGCGCGRREDRGGRGREGRRREEREERREEREERREREEHRNRRESENDCGCAEAREDSCDVASTIPQPWQEYARRDSDNCQD